MKITKNHEINYRQLNNEIYDELSNISQLIKVKQAKKQDLDTEINAYARLVKDAYAQGGLGKQEAERLLKQINSFK